MSPQVSLNLRSFAATDPGDWSELVDRAVAAEQAGIDRLVVSDHVVFGERLDEYARPEIGGIAGGRQPTGPDGHWLEPLTVLAVLAGRTTRIRLGTGILLAALRRPVVLAKTVATLDVLSDGRVDLGVGVGWQREEYDAAGLDFGERGRLLDHCLDVCRALWTQSPASFADDRLRFDGIHCHPQPRQPGGVPIWVSGTVHPAVARRIARVGSGWIPWGPAAVDVVAAIPAMRSAVADAGGDPDSLQIVGNLDVVRSPDGTIDVDATMATVPALVAAGVTDVRLRIGLPAGVDAASELLRPLVAAIAGV